MTLPLKHIAAALTLCVATTLPFSAHALDDKQKEEFGAFIKEYLIANPEIMLDVQNALEAKQEQARQDKATAAISDNKDEIFNSSSDLALGNPDGDVTIVEFFDYNCGYCKRALSDMDKVISSDSNVRFVLKELPILGPDSVAAHKVSDAFRKLAPEKYAEFHRTLLGSQGRATEDSAIAVATSLGVSEADIRAQMASNPNDQSVRETYQLASNLGITGTPSYVVGDEALFGALGAELLEQKVKDVRQCGGGGC